MRACRVLLLMAVLAGSMAKAQEMPAVGRISYAATPTTGAAICTGTLVAPDLVLTAGHCLRGAVDDPATVWFAAGYRDLQNRALVQGAEVILMGGAGEKDLAHDLALLRLAQPISADQVTPLPLADPDTAAFTIIAYRRDAPGRAEQTDACMGFAVSPAILGLSCPVVSGNSGAPVLQQTEAGWQVAAVIVASANGGRVRALAAIPARDLRTRIAGGSPATP